MPTDPRKRQKKLEHKAARRKEKKHLIVRQESVSLATRFALAAPCPVLHSCIADTSWDQGIGQVHLTRVLPDGRVAVAIFLVDRFCLGVKSSIADIVPRATYDIRYAPGIPGAGKATPYPPAAVRKYVEGAVAYARDLGFGPDEDYQVAKLIFGDIDPTTSSETFEYGKDGKPFYISGPHESPQRMREIMATLARTRGPGGSDFLLLG
jgi:hypothetical protein